MFIVWQYNDVWVLKLTSNGDVSWQKTYGGIGSEQSFYIGLALVDGGYLVTSTTDSFATGGTDVLVLKLDGNAEIPNCDIISSSDITVTDTSFIAQDTNAAVTSTSANAIDTSIIPLLFLL